MTGLPPLEVPALDDKQRRSLLLWLTSATARIEREAIVSAVDGAEVRGRIAGASRLGGLLLSCLPVETDAG